MPYAESHSFEQAQVAIRRWFGATGITLSDMIDETVEKVFGGMDIDIIE